MATFYSTGPVLLWVGPQIIKNNPYTQLPTGTPIFLGTAEVTPSAEIRRQLAPAYNDLSGAVPFDLNFLGEDAVLAIDLTRWDERTYAIISNYPATFGAATRARGSWNAVNGMGSLQNTDGWSITVYMVFPYGFPTAAPNRAGRAFGMPTGYRFHGGGLINDKLHQMGNKYRKLHLTFQFAPIVQTGTFKTFLYDHEIPNNLATPAA